MKKHGFAYLNTTQFLGVLNDNLFKLLLIFMLIEVQGVDHSEIILSLAGAIFVIPFLLFSIPSGVLADRYPKNRIVILIKILEVASALIGVIAFAYESAFGGYLALFLLATSGAIFGPTKYGIVPELVPFEKISSANGYLSSGTFLAIIIGTGLAGGLTVITNNNYFHASLVCLFLALLGLGLSFLVPKTEPARSKKTLSPLFFMEVITTLKQARRVRYLLIAILGSAYFLFVGGYTQLNIIPYAIYCMKLTDVEGGYLFLVTALGIGLGSLIAGKLSGSRVELGLSPIGIAGMALCCFLLGICSTNLPFVCTVLFFVGIFGGLYLVPLDAYIQAASPADERGQNVAANNFMGFLGVLIASGLIYLLGQMLKLPPQDGFTLLGFLTSIIALFYIILLRTPIATLFTRKE